MQVLSYPKVMFIEPFYGGSHKVLIDTFTGSLTDYEIITLPAKKWHWRARCGALSLHELIPSITSEKILFCSSVLNLAELLGLRPDLQPLKKVVYFHENQLIYPVRDIKERDVQYSYNQIITCIAADVVLFNSYFNQSSFLDNIKKITKLLPDWRPKNLKQKIECKCQVLYFPMDFSHISAHDKLTNILHIVWPHRWEFDKGPEDFFSVLMKLKEEKIPFKLSILGEPFTDNPPIFTTIKLVLKEEILNFGYIQSKSDYYNILASSHVVVSTAKHEFFGVAM
ncbi:glycosyltransferase-like domain-containing protein 1 isoform X2 [Tribolium madens]|nr:glycosyltransferase-like domain-containing protein 1 isoform X2 [Tribolium madens]